ncbi:MAG TPA: ester cyclase [Acidimicrobiales bacterium]|nr:ester cyclase [Acidimicrobiales bacterium]
MKQPVTISAAVARHVVSRVFEEVWNGGLVKVLGEVLTADFAGHGVDGETFDADVLASRVRSRRQALPDLHYDVVRYVVEVPWVATMWSGQGRPTDAEPGAEPVRLSGLTLWRLDGGRIGEAWALGFEGRQGWEAPQV